MNTDEKECPYCFEIIKLKAIKCKHCGSFLNEINSKLDSKVYGLSEDEKSVIRQEAMIEAEVELQYTNQKIRETVDYALDQIIDRRKIEQSTKGGCGKEIAVIALIFFSSLYLLIQ